MAQLRAILPYLATCGWAFVAFLAGQFAAARRGLVVAWRCQRHVRHALRRRERHRCRSWCSIRSRSPCCCLRSRLARGQSRRVSGAGLAADARPDGRRRRHHHHYRRRRRLLYLTGRAVVSPFQVVSYTDRRRRRLAPLMLFATVIVAPAGEESLFRGYLFRGFVAIRNSATWPAIVGDIAVMDRSARAIRLDRHVGDIRCRSFSRLGALAQRLDAADVPASRPVQPRRHDRNHRCR